MEAIGSTDRKVLRGKSPAGSRRDVSIGYRSTNLSFALVRWPHPRGLPPAFQTLAGSGRVGRHAARCLEQPIRNRKTLKRVPRQPKDYAGLRGVVQGSEGICGRFVGQCRPTLSPLRSFLP